MAADSGLDRRLMLRGAAGGAVLAILGDGVARGAEPGNRRRRADGGDDAARMPDGSLFTRWEQPLTFSRTYYVDNTSPAADDEGPGDQARPFKTIGKAADILQPGERVVIAAGVYRECVRPARGGTGPSQMISYEAAPGAKVFIRGSEILKDGWRQETIRSGPGPGGAEVAVWRYELSGAMFPDAYNPFALPSMMGSWVWLDTKAVDLGPYLRKRGLVFVDGKPLEPMEQLRELAAPNLPTRPDFTVPATPQNGMPARRRGGALMQEIGGSPSARFWVDNAGSAIYVRLASGTPADHLIEATTRQHAFTPTHSGVSFIRVKGLTFQHAGNAYPFPQYGMVSPAGGDHWILEDNTFEWANGVGLDIGSDGDSAGAPHPGASQIVRGNTFRYCGVEGIGGMGTSDALIEDNLIEWCGWADAERGWESAAAKFHRARNMLFRRNVIRHIRYANGAWWDVDNVNCRITQNVFTDILTVGAAIHMEMTPAQNAIDNNIIWDVRNAEPGTPGQRGCAGSGIFDNASDKLIIAHNLIGRCDNAGVFAIVRPDRGGGTARGNVVSNNIFAHCGKAGIVFLNRDNAADGNVYVGMPAQFQGLFEGDLGLIDPEAWRRIRYWDLAAWRSAYGWDRNSATTPGEISLDAEALQLRVTLPKTLTASPPAPQMEGDLLGRRARQARSAGPLRGLQARATVSVDPRWRT